MKALAMLAVLLGASPAFAQIDFSGGFGTGTGMQANGNASFTGGRARLTPGAESQAGSVFHTTTQTVTSFTTTFTFQFTQGASASMADGLCFVLQRQGATALGTAGGQLGYQGITPSVAVKFDIYTAPNSYTGIYTNGGSPDAPETQINPNIHFHSHNIFQAELDYDGATLTVTITDMGADGSTPGNIDLRTYTVDIPTVVGDTTAYVGFTGATGGSNAIQDIVTWTYTNPPAAPGTLTATQDLRNQIDLTWSRVFGAAGYNVWASSTSGGPYTLLANVADPTNTYTHAVAQGSYYYVVTAVGGGGEGGNSPEAMGISLGVPRTNDHDEGLFGDRCACGSSASPGSLFWVVVAAALLTLAPGRR